MLVAEGRAARGDRRRHAGQVAGHHVGVPLHDHRLAPQKFLHILNVSKKVLGNADGLDIEVEYQQNTIGKFGLEFDGKDFVLTEKKTACLAQDACGIPPAKMADQTTICCSPKGGCC